MLSSRRLQALMLLFVVLIAGFLLFDTFFVQETTAQSGTTECDVAQAYHKAVCGMATYICQVHGMSSDHCAGALAQCSAAFSYMINICQN